MCVFVILAICENSECDNYIIADIISYNLRNAR